MRRRALRVLAILLIAAAAPLRPAAGSEAAAWRALAEGGVVALMRHARAPGFGDPDDFRIDDCATQRNLSDEGRAQARRFGEAIRARGIAVDAVYSSQWCRCLETARLLGLGPVEELPALNSFFQRPERREPQMRDLRAWLADARPAGMIVLVTHQVVVTAVAGGGVGSGEMVVARPRRDGSVEVIGRIPPP